MTQSEIAFRAAAYVEDHGLAKGFLWDETGAACLNGAVISADCGRQSWYDEFPALSPEGRRLLGVADEVAEERFGLPAIKWNNLPETTPEDVAGFLRQLGADLKARGL